MYVPSPAAFYSQVGVIDDKGNVLEDVECHVDHGCSGMNLPSNTVYRLIEEGYEMEMATTLEHLLIFIHVSL